MYATGSDSDIHKQRHQIQTLVQLWGTGPYDPLEVSQVERVMEINELRKLSKEVVEAVRELFVIGP
jgi:hypothetical protein